MKVRGGEGFIGEGLYSKAFLYTEYKEGGN